MIPSQHLFQFTQCMDNYITICIVIKWMKGLKSTDIRQ